MDIAPDISKRIRVAIKAKLGDLGACADDELLDYIMVMVANKKSKEQMTEDLQLFLSDSTASFTEWLQALLEKLRTVREEARKHTVDKPSDPNTKETTDRDALMPLQIARKLEKETAEEENDVKKPAEPVKDTEPVQLQKQIPREPKKIDLKEARRRESSRRTSRDGKSHSKRKVSVVDDEVDMIQLQPENDEFASELAPTEKSAKLPKRSRRSDEYARDREHRKSRRREGRRSRHSGRSASRDRSSRRRRSPREHREHSSDHRTKHRTRSSRVERDSRREAARVEPRVEPRVESRAEPQVTRPAVHGDRSESEEEYDPRRPAISSTVERPKRRELPPNLQPSKSLILRAMTEAKSSVETSRRTGIPGSEETVESVHKIREGRVQKKSLRDRLGGRERLDKMTRASTFKCDTESSKLSLTQRLGRRTQDSKISRADVTPPKKKSMLDRLGRQLSPPPRVRQSLSPEARSESLSVSDDSDSRPEERDIDVREASPALDVHPQDQDISDSENSDNEQSPEESESPKFVVTLEGASSPSKRPGIKARLGPRVTVAGDSGDDAVVETVEEIETEEMEVEEDRAGEKRLERCRFWPGCNNGDSCPFVHPSQPCTKFPRCSFGDRCVYIHPNCRFGASCTRPDCPFTHMTRKTAVTPKVTIPPRASLSKGPPKPPCKFFPNCTNAFCPFTHPKTCRNGASCSSRDTCPFHHPVGPAPRSTTSKYKWSRSTKATEPATTPVPVSSETDLVKAAS